MYSDAEGVTPFCLRGRIPNIEQDRTVRFQSLMAHRWYPSRVTGCLCTTPTKPSVTATDRAERRPVSSTSDTCQSLDPPTCLRSYPQIILISLARIQHRLSGAGAAGLLKRLTPASIDSLDIHRSTLSILLHPTTGGIVDDTIITRLGPDSSYAVTNAACRDKDVAYLSAHIAAWNAEMNLALEWEILEGWGLVASQGSLSAEILASVLGDPKEAELKNLYFGQSKFLRLSCLMGRIPSSCSYPEADTRAKTALRSSLILMRSALSLKRFLKLPDRSSCDGRD
jgi:hypothetical protein